MAPKTTFQWFITTWFMVWLVTINLVYVTTPTHAPLVPHTVACNSDKCGQEDSGQLGEITLQCCTKSSTT